MEFKEIKNLKQENDIKELYENSFPEEERVDFYSLFSGVFKNFKLYCLYEGQQLIGMAHFNNSANFIHLNYLAITKNYQSMGYGTKTISYLKEKFNNKAIVVDIEELDDNATNSHNRIRRIHFYKKNGFVEGKYCFMWNGTFMTYMNTEKINADEFMNYIQVIFPTIIDVRAK